MEMMVQGLSRVFGPHRDDDAELGWNHVETLRAVFADPVQHAATVTHRRFRFDDHLDPLQMLRQRTPIGIAAPGGRFGGGLGRRRLRFDTGNGSSNGESRLNA